MNSFIVGIWEEVVVTSQDSFQNSYTLTTAVHIVSEHSTDWAGKNNT